MAGLGFHELFYGLARTAPLRAATIPGASVNMLPRRRATRVRFPHLAAGRRHACASLTPPLRAAALTGRRPLLFSEMLCDFSGVGMIWELTGVASRKAGLSRALSRTTPAATVPCSLSLLAGYSHAAPYAKSARATLVLSNTKHKATALPAFGHTKSIRWRLDGIFVLLAGGIH